MFLHLFSSKVTISLFFLTFFLSFFVSYLSSPLAFKLLRANCHEGYRNSDPNTTTLHSVPKHGAAPAPHWAPPISPAVSVSSAQYLPRLYKAEL